MTIPTIVPYQNIAISTEKEVEPIGVGGSYHPLVYKSIRIAHYYGRLIQVFVGAVISVDFCSVNILKVCAIFFFWTQIIVEIYTCISGTWEEHAIYFGLFLASNARYHEVATFEVLFHNEFTLQWITKYHIVIACYPAADSWGATLHESCTFAKLAEW